MHHQVQIRVKGQIDERWSDWLDGLAVTHTGEDETLLTGSILDQSALYGLIAKLRDLGLPLLSVNLFKEDSDAGQESSGNGTGAVTEEMKRLSGLPNVGRGINL